MNNESNKAILLWMILTQVLIVAGFIILALWIYKKYEIYIAISCISGVLAFTGICILGCVKLLLREKDKKQDNHKE